jgi:stearoyl-CoA desaturase (delta-9 desaturase)
LGTVVPIAVTLGMVFPAVLGAAYGDVMGGFIYAGLVARLLSAFSAFTLERLTGEPAE